MLCQGAEYGQQHEECHAKGGREDHHGRGKAVGE